MDITAYALSSEPYNLAQQTGVWEVHSDVNSVNKFARQMVLQTPISWCRPEIRDFRPVNVIGDKNWFVFFLLSMTVNEL